MENSTQDYISENGLKEEYQNTFFYLYQIMIRRALNNYPEKLLGQARVNHQDLEFPKSRRGIDAYSDIKLMEFIIEMKDLKLDIVTAQVMKQFPFITKEEQDSLLNLITRFYEKGYPQI